MLSEHYANYKSAVSYLKQYFYLYLTMCAAFLLLQKKKQKKHVGYINVNGAQCRYLLCKLSARISQTSQHSDYCTSCKPNTRSLSLIYIH